MSTACESGVPPFPVVFALRNFQIHIHSTNSSDITANIEVSVDQTFSFHTNLGIPYIHPNDCHV